MRDENPQTPPPPVWSGYDNRGGDKLWPLPEKLRPFAHDSFIPEPEIDGPAWTLERVSKREGILTSPRSKIPGVEISRRVTLDENRPLLTLRNIITRVSPSPFPVHAWSVTQVRLPRYFVMESRADLFPGIRRYYRYRGTESVSSIDESPSAIRLGPGKTDFDKVYSIGRYIAAVHDDVAFLQWTSPAPSGNETYSEGANLQVYYNPVYAEVEIASPLGAPRVGEHVANIVHWMLIPLARGEADDWPGVVRKIEALLDAFPEAPFAPSNPLLP
ncbi:hypothetical protein [Geminisphaera colitermitum]|uniref:hypothetical protein n=1 Tax=Geminisphaera colitermitum TaxID=1148786 RepID=UPI0002DB2568|nr:hypothetical protein [Geminisphaera colitermitum]